MDARYVDRVRFELATRWAVDFRTKNGQSAWNVADSSLTERMAAQRVSAEEFARYIAFVVAGIDAARDPGAPLPTLGGAE